MTKLFRVSALSLAASAGLLMAEGFDLGKISVGESQEEAALFEASVYEDDILLHNQETIAQALDSVSGVFMSKTGGRNETTVSIRGFDARRVAVFIDGVPIYVPYDGNFDYGRFATADVASIEVSKGFSSIVYGANTLAGVVNIVSKKPAKALEGSIRMGTVMDSDNGTVSQHAAVNVGTRAGNVYAQVGASTSDRDHFRLSDDFEATASQPEGDRLRSASQDQKVSAKVGYLFESGGEVAVGYAKQEAEKEQPPVADTEFSKVKYWDWPKWDKESVYLIGQKELGAAYVKATLYYDYYNNALNSYDDATYTAQTKGYAFISEYRDTTRGARLELGHTTEANSFKVAANYKFDIHNAYDTNKFSGVESKSEDYRDKTLSLGIEESYRIDAAFKLIAGIGYDVMQAESLWDSNTDINLTKPDDQSALNPEAALVYTLEKGSDLRVSIAQKTHLPTMKERYSRRLGSAIPNENLDAEQATHYEVAYHLQNESLRFTSALYYTTIYDAIQSVVVDSVNDIEQNQNVGDFVHQGLELEAAWFGDSVEAGGSYAFAKAEDTRNSGVEMVGIPEHTLFAYGKYEPAAGLSLYADIDHRQGAFSKNLANDYIKVPAFTLFGAKVAYTSTIGIEAELGVKNLTDEDYLYDMGYPEPGREYYANVNYRF